MQYSPKLKQAAEEIKAILAKYDIGGIVLLHTPGFAEFVKHVNPSYSCCTLAPDGELRIKAKLADFNGDKAAWKKTVEDSLGMIHAFTSMGGFIMLPLMELEERVSKIVDAEHFGGGFTSHNTQNN